MNRLLNRLKILFLVLFAAGAAGVWVYQWFWVRPAEKCGAQENWWDRHTRTCATPVVLSDLTGRPVGTERTPEQVEAARAKSGLKRGPSKTAETQPAAAPQG